MSRLKRWIGGFSRWMGSLSHAGMAAAFLSLFVLGQEGGSRLALMLVGWIYGIGVLGLIRLFRVAPWAYPIVGLLCGPVPFAILSNGGKNEDYAGGLILTGILGLVIGLLELARQRYLRSQEN